MEIEATFIQDIRLLLQQARQQAYSAVNSAMVEAYWNIGKRIVEEEQKGSERAGYGEGLIKELSRQLTGEFGKGFSLANLKNFRQFYLTFPDAEKSYALRSQLTWTHLRLVMRVENPQVCTYYLQESALNFALLATISIVWCVKLGCNGEPLGDCFLAVSLSSAARRDQQNG